ncbi:uncharacterized protein LAESUDRAFT_760470 [Laetiporus sulphureus 93-53]|uniref:Uncharacterized protein n=1 Tax=Laetiporus sulphureus 93-53 TaxID=1314785 RepID=A0A165DNZ2_9APHY|nr:uncharacterized protein LAESUDRAFT_760470 [Laetiporus sulphureus 93-53]KZT05303.1 hypothetical protein LAESUDRAFT_760470 [Laetiporus sulphureus 93-53]
MFTTDDDEDTESAIWPIDASTSTIVAHWVILLLTSNGTAFTRSYGTTLVVELIWEIDSLLKKNTFK